MLNKKTIIFLFSLFQQLIIGETVIAYEQPIYTIEYKNNYYEIRNYNSQIVAQTNQEKGSNKAFRRLFKYISGENQSSSKISMTIPVLQSEKINMTQPILESKSEVSSMMQFFLPTEYKLDEVPTPTNPLVEITVLPSAQYAVVQFNGRSSDKNFLAHARKLKAKLKEDKINFLGPHINATYNGPFTPFFLRKNEIMFRLSNK